MEFPLAMKVLIALSFLPFQMTGAQEGEYKRWDNGIGHSSWDIGLAKEEGQKLLQLWDFIGEDLKTERNELAGTYVKGGYSAGYFFSLVSQQGLCSDPLFRPELNNRFQLWKSHCR